MSDVWTSDVDWADIETRFVVPPELQHPIPRRVTPRDGEDTSCRARAERGCLAGCLLPLFVLGVLLLLWGGLAALILPLGATTTGIVTGREPGNGRDSTYFLRFRFEANGQTYNSEGQVRTEKWKRARPGDAVSVRYFPFAPGLRPLLADDFSPWASIFGLGTLGLLITGVAGLPLTGLIAQRRGKRLVRYGVPTPAFVVECDHAKNHITFLIRDQKQSTIEIKVRPKSPTTYRVGQVETALYLPNKPQGAQLHNDLDWKARVA